MQGSGFTPNPQTNPKNVKYQTSPVMVRSDWLASGISPDLIDSNKKIILEEAKQNLNAWIAEFVSSFKAGRLRETLGNSYFLREEGILQAKSGSVKGLEALIQPRTLQKFHYLLSKVKQIRYRILKCDPNVHFLLLVTPELQYTTAADILTGQLIELSGNGEVAE